MAMLVFVLRLAVRVRRCERPDESWSHLVLAAPAGVTWTGLLLGLRGTTVSSR